MKTIASLVQSTRQKLTWANRLTTAWIAFETEFLADQIRAKSFFFTIVLSLVVPIAAYQTKNVYAVRVGESGRPLIEGFYFWEMSGSSRVRWSSRLATVHFPGVGGNQAFRLKLRLSGLRPRYPPRVQVTVNQHQMADFTPGGEMTTYEFLVSQKATGWSWDQVVQIHSEVFVPGPDPRELGVLVDWVSLEPVSNGWIPVIPSIPLVLTTALTTTFLFLVLRRMNFRQYLSVLICLLFLATIGWQVATYRMGFATRLPVFLITFLASSVILSLLLRTLNKQLQGDWRNYVGFLLALLLAAAVSYLVFVNVLAQNGPFGWDEAEHSLWGHRIARDIADGNISGFLEHSNAQAYWPPGYSWLQAPLFLALGETMISARLLSLVSLFLTAIVTYVTALQLSARGGWLVGILAVVLILTSRGILELAGLAMIELPVLLVISLTLFAYMKALTSQAPVWYFAAGLGAAFTFLSKYNYGLQMILAIVLSDLSQKNWGLQSAKGSVMFFVKTRSFFLLYLPFFLIATLWFASSTSYKFTTFWQFVVNRSGTVPFWSIQNLLFYPALLAKNYTVSPGVFVLVAAVFVLGMRHIKEVQARVLIIFSALGLAASTVHPLKEARFIAPILPSLWLISAYSLIQLTPFILAWTRRLLSPRLAMSAIALAGAMLIVPDLLSLYFHQLRPTQSTGGASKTVDAILTLLKSQADPTRPVLALGTFAELSPALIAWTFATDHRLSDTPVVFEGPDLPPQTAGHADVLQKWLQRNNSYVVVTFQVGEKSPFFTNDYRDFNAWKLRYVNAMEETSSWKSVYEQCFAETDVTLRIYTSIAGKQ